MIKCDRQNYLSHFSIWLLVWLLPIVGFSVALTLFAQESRYVSNLSTKKNHVTAVSPINMTQPLIQKSIVDDAEIRSEDIATLSQVGLSGATVDLTEDYKAMGYTDNRKIVRGDDGDLYVAYRKKIKSQYRIFVAKSRDQGATWIVLNDNKPVETSGDYTQRTPSLALGKTPNEKANYLHLVWYGNDKEHKGNNRQIKYLRLTTEGKLSMNGCCAKSFNIAGYSGQALWQEHPTIYVNGSNVYIVWEGRDADGASAKIKFVRSTDYGQQWTEPINIAADPVVNFSRPSLVVTYVGEQRQLYTVAYGKIGNSSQIYWSRSLDNGDTWTPWQTVAPEGGDQRHVSIARDKTGKLHIVWRQTTSDNQRTVIRYRVYDPALNKGAGDWVASAQTIASHPEKCLFFPSVAIDRTDRVWVVWTESSDCSTLPSDDPTEGQIVYTSKTLGGKWNDPIILTDGNTHVYASLRRAPTPDSDTMDVVWLDLSSCPMEQPIPDQKQPNQEADVAAATQCTIRYANLK